MLWKNDAAASATRVTSARRVTTQPMLKAAPGQGRCRRRYRALPDQSRPAARVWEGGSGRDAARGASSRSRLGTEATSANRASRSRTPDMASLEPRPLPEWSRLDRTETPPPLPRLLAGASRRVAHDDLGNAA